MKYLDENVGFNPGDSLTIHSPGDDTIHGAKGTYIPNKKIEQSGRALLRWEPKQKAGKLGKLSKAYRVSSFPINRLRLNSGDISTLVDLLLEGKDLETAFSSLYENKNRDN